MAATLPAPIMCSVAQAAALIGVTERHVRNMIARGQLEGVTVRKAGNRTVVNREQLERWCRGEEAAS